MAAETDGKGAAEWSATNNNYCGQSTDVCTRWSGENEPTSEQSFNCDPLYYFWDDVKVLSTCDA